MNKYCLLFNVPTRKPKCAPKIQQVTAEKAAQLDCQPSKKTYDKDWRGGKENTRSDSSELDPLL